MMKKTVSCLGLLLASVTLCSAQVTFTVFPGPPIPSVAYLVAGPDGNLWLTRESPTYSGSSCNTICKMTLDGVITEYDLPNVGIYGPWGSGGPIVVGPDGNLWYSHYFANTIGKVDPSTGSITEYRIPSPYTFPAGIAAGPDGNLWFTEFVGWRIGKITPAGVITEYSVPLVPSPRGYGPARITAGADGNLWFTISEAHYIGKITPDGTITEFPTPTPGSNPLDITAGPDGNVWFTEPAVNKIGRITPAGVITEFPLSADGASPSSITVGPDGNLWFTDDSGTIGKITTSGVVTEFAAPDPAGRPSGITAGPDGNIWFTEFYANKIVRININYEFSGFDSPIDNEPVVNVAKAGSTIPVKWRLTDYEGSPISDPSSFASLKSHSVPQGEFSGDPSDEIEITGAGASGLQYLGNGYWQFNWKTLKSYSGTCRVMVLTLSDGTTHSANFSFK